MEPLSEYIFICELGHVPLYHSHLFNRSVSLRISILILHQIGNALTLPAHADLKLIRGVSSENMSTLEFQQLLHDY